MIILITGIAGTLGTEFTKQLHENNLVMGIDHNERNIAEFKQKFPTVKVYLEDFKSWDFSRRPVDLLIHCAAYKHIEFGEENPHSFIRNNVEATGILFENAYKNRVKILFTSTDKAVEPSSNYGYTKALGEALCREYGGSFARLGNILGSNGSVLQKWEESFMKGEPIKITNLAMTRFYITPESAVKQVLAGFNSGQKEITPECEELSLNDLLWRFKEKHGVFDLPIEVIGARPGEKLKEKLAWDHKKD